jgi:DNA-binding LytR/AlgR family response regulator
LTTIQFSCATIGVGELEEDLQEQAFLRPHKSYLVNIAGIDKIPNRDGGFLVLKRVGNRNSPAQTSGNY